MKARATGTHRFHTRWATLPTMSGNALSSFQARAVAAVEAIQAQICDGLEAVERQYGSPRGFASDRWEREGGGGGLTRVLCDGAVLEKAGVNTSVVFGELSETFARELPGEGRTFFATGVSLVLHPRNPHAPTVHANFRYIEQGAKRWFGGGADLTPYYFYADDRDHFHGVWQRVCAEHREHADYEAFSAWCDRYFYLPHRGERRGVGGIFFDKLFVDPEKSGHEDALLAFLCAGGGAFLPAYEPILRRRLGTPFTPQQRRWQALRRGRYVEFNLLHDRGTVFGLRTGGRTESILMSLPPDVQWGYCEEPEVGTPEAVLLHELRRPPPK